MKIHPFRISLVAAVLLAAGCVSTQSARIQEKSAVFASLTPRQQQLIKAGRVKVGFTTDMVYLALGKPAQVGLPSANVSGPTVAGVSPAKGRSAAATMEEWTYTRYVPNPGEDSFVLPPEPTLTHYHRDGRPLDHDPYADRMPGGAPAVYTLKLLVCDGRVVGGYLFD